MPKSTIVCGLDIGTNKIAIATGLQDESGIQILALTHSENHGMRKGSVVDVEETVSALSATLEEAEKMTGSAIGNVTVGITGHHISSQSSKGVIAVSRGDGEISSIDVEKVIEAARAVALPPNREIIHVIPKLFIVDGQEGLKDPVGLRGIRLEVDSLIINGSSNSIKNIIRVVNQVGLQVSNLVFSPLAASRSILTKQQKESGCLLIDIGAGSTGIVVFEEGDILHATVLPIGSDHITNDIAIGLRTSLEVAEKIKIKYGHAIPDELKDSDMVDLGLFDKRENQKISKKYVAEIIQARLNELFSMITDELRSISRDGSLPAGAIFTGGGCQLKDLIELSKEVLRLPATIGVPGLEISGMVDKLDNPIYSTSIGLLMEGLTENKGDISQHVDRLPFSGVIDRAKGLFRQFLP